MRGPFFVRERGERRIMDFFWFLFLFLKVFLWGFQIIPQVPKILLKTFPIALQIYPIWVCPKFNSHALGGEHICFIFLQLGSKEVLLRGSATCSKTFDDEPINMVASSINK
jgi:hypothetical protein